MNNKPNFLDVWIDFSLSGIGIFAMITTIIMVSFYFAINKYYSTTKENEERKSEITTTVMNFRFVAKFCVIGFLFTTTLATSMTQLNINFLLSDVNKQWFAENLEEIYEDVEEKEIKITDINSVVKVDSESDLNFNYKKIGMHKYLKKKYGEDIYIIQLTIETKKEVNEKVEIMVAIENETNEVENNNMLTVMTSEFESKYKVFIKNTKDSENDVDDNILFGKIVISR